MCLWFRAKDRHWHPTETTEAQWISSPASPPERGGSSGACRSFYFPCWSASPCNEFLELIQSLASQAHKTCVLSAFQNGENLPKLAENEKLGTLVTRESQLLRGNRPLEQSSSSNDPPAARKFSKKNYMETLTTGKAHFVSAIFSVFWGETIDIQTLLLCK